MKTFNEIFQEDDSLRNFREYLKMGDVLNSFAELFPDLENIARPVRVDKQVLLLKVENSVWRSELKFRQKIIVDRINDHFGESILKSVKFTG